MRNRVEVRLEVRIDDVDATEVDPLVDFPQGVMGALARPEPIGEIFEVGLEQRFDDDLHCRLHHTIFDDRNAERALRSVGLRDVDPSDRLGSIALRAKPALQLAQESVEPDLPFDMLEGLVVDARSAAIGLDLPVGEPEDIFLADLVIKHSELARRIRLGCSV